MKITSIISGPHNRHATAIIDGKIAVREFSLKKTDAEIAATLESEEKEILASRNKDNNPPSIFDAMTDEQLREYAESKGIKIPATVTRRETILAKIAAGNDGKQE